MATCAPTGRCAPARVVTITGTDVQSLMAKLDVIRPCLPPPPPEEFLDSAHYTAEEGEGKHVMQEASIIGHLDRIGALGPRTAVAVELGAGTAKLSDRLHAANGNPCFAAAQNILSPTKWIATPSLTVNPCALLTVSASHGEGELAACQA